MVVIDRLRRRAAGERVLVYLDQSALSAFVRQEERYHSVLDYLQRANEAGEVVCLRSKEHEDETMLAPYELWSAIDRLSDRLATGIEFRVEDSITWKEIYAAAAQFVGAEEDRGERWKEAFRTDPQIPRDRLFTRLFGGSVRIRTRFDPDESQIARVERTKQKEAPMTTAYAQLRNAGYSFEDMAEANLDAMIRWKLGPLVDSTAQLESVRRHAEWLEAAASEVAPSMDPGSPLDRMQAFSIRDGRAKRLAEVYPGVAERAAEFAASDVLRHMPTVAYPALFRAALAATPNRKMKPGDGYDIAHLTRGLSRCDVVTADSGMTQLVSNYKLLPSGCALLSVRELDKLPAAIEAARTQGDAS